MKDENKNRKKATTGFEKNKNFVPVEALTDPPSRLFRKVLTMMGMNLSTWNSYMNEYLRWIHPDGSATPAEVKKMRSTTLGNAQTAYFFSKSLSFNKLIAGFKILKYRRVKFIIEAESATGEVLTVSETVFLGKENPPTGADLDD